jgi:glycosyltransferase involved in cell wall biosynthesis
MQKLISIAIPTWNRASYLDNALGYILPQVYGFQDEIEVIISDNGSTDNTQQIIHNYVKNYKEISFVLFKHPKNTGYFGNFAKCKKLANGKFFWLLSDNDYVRKGILKKVIQLLMQNPNLGSIHFSYNTSKFFLTKNTVVKKDLSNDELFQKAGIYPSLISSVIFRNIKDDEKDIFKRFSGNSFLGFAMYINALKYYSNNIIIYGKTFNIDEKAGVSFNFFESFIIDMQECINYLQEEAVVKSKALQSLKCCILNDVLKRHIIDYRITNAIDTDFFYPNEFERFFVGTAGYYSIDKMTRVSKKVLIVYRFTYKIYNRMLRKPILRLYYNTILLK